MKKIINNKAWAIVLVGLFACTDLDLKPKGSASSDVLLTTPEGYKAFLAKIYGGLANSGQSGPSGNGDIRTGDEGFSEYIRGLWNAETMPTDEAVTLWGDPGLKDYHAHTWTSQSPFITQFYYRIFYQIALANQFLREISDSKLDSRGLPADFKNTTAKTYRAEARLLRALSYWHGLNYFRNIPFTDENSGIGAPAQATPQKIFNFIETEIKAIEADLPAPKANEYGRFDKAVAWTILAKLYLNAEVYLGSGNKKYTECITYCDKIISSNKYQLQANYQELFLTDNNSTDEIIFGVPADGKLMPNYGGVTLIINGGVGGNLAALPQVNGRNPIMGNNQGWAGHRTTKNIVNLFQAGDSRALFYTSGQNLEINDINQFADGYMVIKYKNVNKSGTPGQDGTFTDTDFPLFRLADIYLMYAEAGLRGGTGGSSDPVQLFNLIRERAFGDTSADVVSLDLDLILDERGRELYWEGQRRTDMVRFGVFSSNPSGNVRGLWPWKGGSKDGIVTDSFRDIFPIPSSDIIANTNLKQNSGY